MLLLIGIPGRHIGGTGDEPGRRRIVEIGLQDLVCLLVVVAGELPEVSALLLGVHDARAERLPVRPAQVIAEVEVDLEPLEERHAVLTVDVADAAHVRTPIGAQSEDRHRVVG